METPLIVSIDDHVLETPQIWQDRLPSRYRDTGPRVVRERGMVAGFAAASHGYEQRSDGRWCDVWHYEDEVMPLLRGTAQVGYEVSDDGQHCVTFDEVRP